MVSRILRAVPLGRLRLAETEDVRLVMQMVTDSMSRNFRVHGESDISYLIETCILTICQLDINESIVGFLALKDYPMIPAVNPAAWEDFIWNKYKSIELNARNTLFIHMLCWNPVYAREVVDSMLKSVFMHDPFVHFIGMMKSLINFPLLVPGQSRSEASFKRVQALERGVPGDQLPALWVAERREVSPRLRIRRAVEEDNDDIVPIIERHSTRLRELYGDFYVSELIARHPESERVLLVCEHKELAVGVMCLNTQINYEALEESFELSPFAGLRHLDAMPKLKEQDSAVSLYTGADNVNSQRVSDSSTKDARSQVTWVFEEIFKKLPKDVHHRLQFAPVGSYSQLEILNLLEDEDEEEMEFDIVNIDSDLLKPPRLFINDESKKQRTSEESVDFKKDAKDKTKLIHYPPSAAIKPPEPTRFSGRPNAFLLELFAMHPDYDERYGFDMLEAAFELFPDRNYCVMCLPSSHTCFPLLENFTLVTPFSFRMRFMNDTLYVSHVNTIRGDVRVRPAEAFDDANLKDVLEHAPHKEVLMELFDSSLTSTALDSYALLSQNQPIGFIVLGPLEEASSIRTQYDLDPEPRRAGTDAVILACVMSPVMEPHGRWYIRDVLRQTKFTTLFWLCRLFAKGDASPSRNLMSLASFMRPVLPRRCITNLTGDKNLDRICKKIATPFALWSVDRLLTSLPKVHINNSIVVVGASRTGLAFLETLLMGPTSEYLTFTNITLVSQNGLPTVADSLRAAEVCVPRDGRYNNRYLKTLPFYYYVDVMSAVMVRIDRKKKCIHLKGGGKKFYDELVLTCGEQFQHPEYMRDSIALAKEIQKGKPCDRQLMDDPTYKPDCVPPLPDTPENLMLINSLYEANACLKKLTTMILETKDTKYALCEDNPVVVYGDYIEAYSCIAGLIDMGILAKFIAFVEPFPPEDNTTLRINCFNNEIIDRRVQKSIEKLGIRVYRQCYFHGWSLRNNFITLLRFMTPLHVINLSCFSFFYYGIKAIDLNAFKAINESGLVYDGGVVIGPQFTTNDPCVSAAGACTRYSRRLYAPRHAHRYYCSEDVGEALANLFLRKLDPFSMGQEDLESGSLENLTRYSSSILACRGSRASLYSSSRMSICSSKSRWQPVPRFSSPIVQAATLPGPLHYMALRAPGPDVPMPVHLLLPKQGHTLMTDKRQSYFRLQLDALHRVVAVTCLSRAAFPCDALAQLYGKHEAYFDNLLARYELNIIDDLFTFFSQPWISAFYQEPFSTLIDDIYENGGNTVRDVVHTKFDEFFKGDKSDESKISMHSTDKVKKYEAGCQECGQNSTLRHEVAVTWQALGGEDIVTSQLARYLHKNALTHPHYATPEDAV